MKDILTSPRIKDMKRKRRAQRIRLLVLLFVLFISVITALAYFSSNHRVTINNIVVTGTRIINIPDVESSVHQQLSGKYLHLFSRANTFIYPEKRIYNALLADFPRIEKLTITRDNWNALHIAIEERTGAYLYCGAKIPEAPSDIGENCYFVNNDGYIFDKAPYFSGNVYFKYYTALSHEDSADSSNPLGLQMMDKDKFHSLMRFIDKITLLHFKPIYIVVDADGTNSLYLNNDGGVTSPKIIFKDDNDLNTILDNLTASMAKPEFANDVNSKYTTLLYIDLRFNNKVLYKFNE